MKYSHPATLCGFLVVFVSLMIGVGGAMVSGYKQARKENMDIVIKLDADGQMDPSLIPHFIAPILEGRADYTKGNRFYHPDWLEDMPIVRLMGNAILSFLSKISTGYWNIFDPRERRVWSQDCKRGGIYNLERIKPNPIKRVARSFSGYS